MCLVFVRLEGATSHNRARPLGSQSRLSMKGVERVLRHVAEATRASPGVLKAGQHLHVSLREFEVEQLVVGTDAASVGALGDGDDAALDGVPQDDLAWRLAETLRNRYDLLLLIQPVVHAAANMSWMSDHATRLHCGPKNTKAGLITPHSLWLICLGPWTIGGTKWAVARNHNALGLGKLNELGVVAERVHLDLKHGRLDACHAQHSLDLRDVEVGQADGAHQTSVHELLHSRPRLREGCGVERCVAQIPDHAASQRSSTPR